MPAKVTLFSASCKPVYDLGSGPYNLVRWNPFGRFFAIAGFGNLPGEGGNKRARVIQWAVRVYERSTA